EIAYDTHPNDLFAGEEASFRLLMNGKPVSGVEVTIIPGESRYRDTSHEIKPTTDDGGRFSVIWPTAGRYWLNAGLEDKEPSIPQATTRRASYTVTLEVLPQ